MLSEKPNFPTGILINRMLFSFVYQNDHDQEPHPSLHRDQVSKVQPEDGEAKSGKYKQRNIDIFVNGKFEEKKILIFITFVFVTQRFVCK